MHHIRKLMWVVVNIVVLNIYHSGDIFAVIVLYRYNKVVARFTKVKFLVL